MAKYWLIGAAALLLTAAAVVAVVLALRARNNILDGPTMENSYAQIDQDEAKEMMAKDDGHIIVDVRRQDEFDAGHIPGAILIPNEDIGAERPDALPDPDQVILIYCRSGRRSKEAAQKLFDMGYTHIFEFGGIIEWTGAVVKDVEITFRNDAVKADVWLIPATEANRKTTLWGTASAAACEVGESRALTLEQDVGAEAFLFRAIDADGMYYSAGDVVLEAGYSVVFKGGGDGSYMIEVLDADGRTVGTYAVFAAML